jgi:hypothetical protein
LRQINAVPCDGLKLAVETAAAPVTHMGHRTLQSNRPIAAAAETKQLEQAMTRAPSRKQKSPGRKSTPPVRERNENAKGNAKSDVTYEIVEHDGGWAYKVNGVFSEPFPAHADALAAAQRAAEGQEIPGDTETIEYEDDRGGWHTETAEGRDRPHTTIKDKD